MEASFIKCIQNNELEAVEAALVADSSIVHIIYDKTTPLVEAVKKKHVEIVRLLLQYDAVVDNKESRYQETPLFYAIAIKDDNILNILLEKADVNKKIGVNQKSALHHAIYMGNVSAVRKLVSHKDVDLTLQDKEGNTPLHAAVDVNNVKMVFKIAGHLEEAEFHITNKNGLIPEQVQTANSAEAIQALKAVFATKFRRRSMPEQRFIPLYELKTKSVSMYGEKDCPLMKLKLLTDTSCCRLEKQLSPEEFLTPIAECCQQIVFPHSSNIRQDSAPSLCGDITSLPNVSSVSTADTNSCIKTTNYVCSAAGYVNTTTENGSLDHETSLPNAVMVLPAEDEVDPVMKVDASTPKNLSQHAKLSSLSMSELTIIEEAVDSPDGLEDKGTTFNKEKISSALCSHPKRYSYPPAAAALVIKNLPTHLYIKDLIPTDVKRLENHLQAKDISGFYWELLCMKLIDCDCIILDKNTIELWKIAGGSNIGKSIIEIIRTSKPLFTVQEFIDVAKKCKRNDIYEHLKKYKDDLLNDLPHLVNHELEVLCSLQSISKCWKTLAEECGINSDLIDKIELVCYEQKISPVKHMFSYFQQKHPELTLSCIVEKLYALNINGAAETLMEIIQERTRFGIETNGKKIFV